MFRIDGPTTVLFECFPALAREVSTAFYEDSLGADFANARLVPTATALSRQNAEREESEIRDRFFGAVFNALRPLSVTPAARTAPADLSSSARDLEKMRTAIEQGMPAYRKNLDQFATAELRQVLSEQAAALIDGGLKVKPADFHIERSDVKAAVAAREAAFAEQQKLAPLLSPIERCVARKLSLALSLLRAPAIASRLSELTSRETELDQLCDVVQCLHASWPEVLHLRSAHACLTILIHNLEKNAKNNKFRKTLETTRGNVAKQITVVHQAFSGTQYPFDHAIVNATVAHYALEKLPKADDLGEVYVASDTLLKQLNLLAARVAGRLAAMAMPVEEMVSAARAASKAAAAARPQSP